MHALTVCVVTIGAATASAHPVSLSRAQVVVHEDHVDVSIEAPAEDLLHYELIPYREGGEYAFGEIRAAGERYAKKIRDGFILRDASGARLPGTIVSWSLSPQSDDEKQLMRLTNVWLNVKIRVVAEHEKPLRFVTFQHRPAQTTQILLTRLGTTVRQAGRDDRMREIVLTSGGNAETLEFVWGKAPASNGAKRKDARAWLGDERFKQVHAVLTPEARGADIYIVVPATIAETWQPIRRAREDVISLDEQAHVTEDWQKRLAKAVTAKVGGENADVVVTRVAIIGPGSAEVDFSESRPAVGFHSARIVGHLRVTDDCATKGIDLVWKLFNEAVPAAKVLVVDGTDAIAYPVSAYSPNISWRRGE